jgi:hypothetical protein
MGVIVGMLVSNSTRSGHFRSELILMTGLSVPALVPSAIGNFGRTKFEINSSASKTPPT